MPWVTRVVRKRTPEGQVVERRVRVWEGDPTERVGEKQRRTLDPIAIERAAQAAKRRAREEARRRRAEAYRSLQARAAKLREGLRARADAMSQSERLKEASYAQAQGRAPKPRTSQQNRVVGQLVQSSVDEFLADGKVVKALKVVRDDQTTSGNGGRFDLGSYNKVAVAYTQRYEQARALNTYWYNRINRLVKAGKYTKVMDLFGTDRFKKDYRFLKRVLGPEYKEMRDLSTAVLTDYQTWKTRIVMGGLSPGEYEAMLERRKAAAEAKRAAAEARARVIDIRLGSGVGGAEEPVAGTYTLADYMRQVDAEVARQYRKRLAIVTGRRDMMRSMGMDYRYEYVDGQWRVTDVTQTQRLRDVGRRLDEAGVDRSVLDTATSADATQADRNEAIKTIRDALAGQVIEKWRAKAESLGLPPTRMGPELSARKAAELDGIDDLIQETLLGTRLEGVDRWMWQIGNTPVMKEVLTGLGVPASGIFGLVRRAALETGGRLFGGPARPDRRSFRTRSEYEAALAKYEQELAAWKLAEQDAEAGQWNDLVRTGREAFDPTSPNFDPWKGLSALVAYSGEPTASPLANFLVMSVLDPANFVMPLKWLGAGRAAVARTGGMGRAAAHPIEMLRWARRFSKDKDLRRAFEARTGFRKRYGDGVADEVLAEQVLTDLLVNPENLDSTANRLFRKLKMKVPEADIKAVLAAAMDEGARQGAALGKEVLGGNDLAALVQNATRLARKAEREVKAQRAQVRLADVHDAGRVAVGADREARLGSRLAREEERRLRGEAAEQQGLRDLRSAYQVGADEDPFVVRVQRRDAYTSAHPRTAEARDLHTRRVEEHRAIVERGMDSLRRQREHMDSLYVRARETKARLDKLVQDAIDAGEPPRAIADLRDVRRAELRQAYEAARDAKEQLRLNQAALSVDATAAREAVVAARENIAAVAARLGRVFDRQFDLAARPVLEGRRLRETAERRIAGIQKMRGDTAGAVPATPGSLAVRARLERELDEVDAIRREVLTHLAVVADPMKPNVERSVAIANLRLAMGRGRIHLGDFDVAGGPAGGLPGRLMAERWAYDTARVMSGQRDLTGAAVVRTHAPIAQIDQELRAAQTALDAARRARDPVRIRELRAAMRYLRRERTAAFGRAERAEVVVGQHAKEARDYVRANRVLAKADSVEGAIEEGMRDLYGRYLLPDADDLGVALAGAEEALLASARAVARSRGLDVADARLAPWAGELGGLNLEEALILVSYLSDATYSELAKAVFGQLRRALPDLDPKDYLDLLRREHYGSVADFDFFAAYDRMDEMIANRFHARDRFAAKGSYRGGRRTGGPASPDPTIKVSRTRDTNILDVRDKILVANEVGVPIFAYDEMRPHFRSPALKIGNSVAALEEARNLARTTGRTVDEVYPEVVERRLQYEAEQWLRRYAYEMAGTGAAPEAIWTSFVDLNAMDDLFVPTETAGLNAWQRAQIRRALVRHARIADPDDPAHVAKGLGGVVEPPADVIRLLGPGEFPGAPISIPGYVVRADHPKLARSLTGGGGGYMDGMHISGDGIYVSEAILATPDGPATVLHEWAHALEGPNAPRLQTFLAAHDLRVNGNATSPLVREIMRTYASARAGAGEVFAEMYAIWACGTTIHPGMLHTWNELKVLFPGRAAVFAEAEALFPTLATPVKHHYGVGGFNAPPFTLGQGATYRWLVENGFWAKRTHDEIAAGGRVWDIDTERAWFQRRFGIEPTWTDRRRLEKILDNEELFDEYRRAGGYKDELFTQHQAVGDAKPEDMRSATAYGGFVNRKGEVVASEDIGIKKQRTPEEIRRWMADRFLDLVSDDRGVTLKRAYWLMNPTSPEWRAWVAGYVREVVGTASLSETLALDFARRGKVALPEGMLRPDQIEKFGEAVADTVTRHLREWQKSGARGDIWTPESQLRMAIDVTNELLATRAYLGWRDRPLAGSAMRAWGALQRATVMGLSVPFVLVNAFERVAFRPWLMQLDQAADVWLWGRADADAIANISSMPSIRVGSVGMWDARTRTGAVKLRDPRLALRTRLLAVPQAVAELPLALATVGEEWMQRQVARRIYMSFRDSYLAQGFAPALARAEAKRVARERTVRLFALGEDASDFEKALNQVFPFFSYNYRTGLLFLRVVGAHPSVLLVADRLGRAVEAMNREQWEKDHPKGTPDYIPWDPNDPDNRKLWLKIGDATYIVDLSQYSDVLRAGVKLVGEKAPRNPFEWLNRFIRVPHPMQVGLWALLTNTEGPWGKVEPSDFFWSLDFAASLDDIGDGKDYADLVEFLTDLLTWNRWERADPTQKMAFWYFSLLRQGRYAEAEALLEANPAVDLFVQRYNPPARWNPKGWKPVSYWTGRDRADREQFARDMAEFRAMQEEYEARANALWDQPWSDELKAVKRERRYAANVFLLTHPDVLGVLAMGMSPAEWSEWSHDQNVDDQVEAFFAWDAAMKPVRGDFPEGDRGQLAYLVAKRRYDAARKQYLASHPDVAARLASASTDAMEAWRDFEADQAARFDDLNQIQIKLLLEKLKGEDADRELIGDLYDISAFMWDFQNAGGVAYGRDPANSGLLRLLFLPGTEALKKYRMSPEELAAYEAQRAIDERYGTGMGRLADLVDKAKEARGLTDKQAGSLWWRRLERDPWLLEEYLSRNEDKRAIYEENKAYLKAIEPWVNAIKAGNWTAANRIFDSLDPWVKRKYYENNPGAKRRARLGAAYMSAMQQWVSLLKKGDSIGAKRFFDSLPPWIKERYFKTHPDQRLTLGVTQRMQEKLALYFMADDANRVRLLRQDPELRSFLEAHSSAAERRIMVMAYYRVITDPWAKRVYRDRFPEYFSQEAKARDRARSLAAKLAEHPELVEAWEAAVKMQTEVYEKQLRLQGTRPPKPLDAEHLRDEKRRRRRVRRKAARFSAHWMAHAELRHG